MKKIEIIRECVEYVQTVGIVGVHVTITNGDYSIEQQFSSFEAVLEHQRDHDMLDLKNPDFSIYVVHYNDRVMIMENVRNFQQGFKNTLIGDFNVHLN